MSSQSNPLVQPELSYTGTFNAPALNFLIVGTIFSSFLIPILITMLFFSTEESRRRPVFLLNGLAILIGLVEGGLNMCAQVHAILSPLDPLLLAIYLAMAAMTFGGPLMVECILLFRLVAVYPRRTTPNFTFCAILVVPITMLVARFVNFGCFVKWYADDLRGTTALLGGGQIAKSGVETKIEWILQLVNNSYMSVAFLYRLSRGSIRSDVSVLHSQKLASRLRALFFIALSNFVFPAILNAIQLGLLFGSSNSRYQVEMVYMVNTYVSIIGVIFATVWTSISHWGESTGSSKDNSRSTPIRNPEGTRDPRKLQNFDWRSNPVAGGGSRAGTRKGQLRSESDIFKPIPLVTIGSEDLGTH